MEYNKLVRDRIPEIIMKKGGKFKFHTVEGGDLRTRLKEKLCEEAGEFLQAAERFVETEDEAKLLDELADILEIVDANLRYMGIGMKPLKSQIKRMLSIQRKKAKQRGRFSKGIVLDEA